MRGLFIVFEGVEGSGKSTQARRLVEWLEKGGVPHIATREPGGTAVGEEVRRLLLEREKVSARAELLLMLAARAALVEEVIEPALEDGRVVVSDRFDLSTFAYQGYGRGLPLDDVRRLNAFATGGLKADVTILLDVPRTVGESRRRAEGRTADRIERAGGEFHDRVAEAYALLSEEETNVERIDGSPDPDEVHRRVLRRLVRRFPETFETGTG